MRFVTHKHMDYGRRLIMSVQRGPFRHAVEADLRRRKRLPYRVQRRAKDILRQFVRKTVQRNYEGRIDLIRARTGRSWRR